MSLPKWLVVARNEYRMRTGSIRRFRPYFPPLVIGILAVYVFFLAPFLVDFFIDQFTQFIVSTVALALLEIMLLGIFTYFILIPISSALQELQIGQLEVVLATPIKPSHVLVGEYLGVLPFYAIAATVITGLFTAFLQPLGMSMLQISIIILVFILTLFSALWIGTLLAAILKTALGKTAKGKDIGKALPLLIALPVIALMYALMSEEFLLALADPNTSGVVERMFGLLPSSWGAELIVEFASHPGNISAILYETVLRIGGLCLFFVGILGLGMALADKAYNLEKTTFSSTRVSQDGVFYKTVNMLGGRGSFGKLLVSIFKDYGRRLENLSKILYMIGLFSLMNIFLIEGSDPQGAIVMLLFVLPLLVAFVSSEVTIRGKDLLFLYKKAPSGINRLIKARIFLGWLTVVPIGILGLLLSFLFGVGMTMKFFLNALGVIVLTVAANVMLFLGVFLLNPAFSEKSAKYGANIMIASFLQITLFIFPSLFLDFPFFQTIFYFTLPVSFLLGIILLLLGKRRLNAME